MRLRTTALKEMKLAGNQITCITAYDYQMALLVEEASIEVILVGDSLGNTVLGYDSTIPVTLNDMIHHTKAVARASKSSLIVADMPFLTYNVTIEESLRNAGRLIQEGGAQAVKLEGGKPVANVIRKLTELGIPVMGHLGLTPQSVHQMGGYMVQARTFDQAKNLIEDAQILQESGAFAVVLEAVPSELAKLVTERLSIPTIGIGAGNYCDGQIQVINDILGFSSHSPRHSKQYADINAVVLNALNGYAQEVRDGKFPTSKESSYIDSQVLNDLLADKDL
ncbi:MAG: 3-methyl-2-oxobutanoate hydroxymethyltransferase [Dehalococcoidia bacterium]|nr:3-methyl-2-oxobutanoate hydroxymethyltransferase [Dehalococcoidia bacterium]HCH35904.1 3-methyl-2-oxobutanoate hydroxymethyltransferase [Dehalococcoidia bacterium]|tara:strand:+ start:1521 stop:2360 length:840 start_codon:yes stop_codon:yes gene_type:complete